MGTGYTRTDTINNIADGNIINASDFDAEYDAIEAAFNSSSGHTHDGTSSEGGPVTVLGPAQDFVASTTEIKPKTNNTLDIGTTGLKFKDMNLAGTANLVNLTTTGDVTLTGAANNIVFDASDNALEFADSAKATFGADADLQIFHDTSNRMQYDFYINTVRKRKRFSPWEKKEKLENLDAIKEYYNYSTEKAQAVLKILNSKQIDYIKSKLNRGGKT